MKTTNSQHQLDRIKDDIVAADVCPELAKQATQLVFGDGLPEARIVFIGEAPGKNEDLQGKPFVGAAGKFLDEMLTMNGLKREEVYITNIVKYRPPQNRDPLPEEKKAFMPYLLRQIQVIKPALVVTLGRHSMEAFLPGLKISTVHGQPKRIKIQQKGEGEEVKTKGKTLSSDEASAMSLVILPLFHPAAALYNGDMRQTLIDDFARIPSIVKQLSTSNQLT